MSLIEDAAEELTFAADDPNDEELSKRKEEDKQTRIHEDRMKLFQNLLFENKTREINQLVDYLAYAKIKSLVMRQLRQWFPDVTDAYAALDSAVGELERKGAPEESLKAAREARAELMDRHGAEIRLGAQAALSAAGYGDLDAEPALRDLYRRSVLDFAVAAELYAHIQNKYPNEKFDRAVAFITHALTADLAADEPSMGKTHLEGVNANLGLVRLVQSVHFQCGRVMERWRGVHGVESCPLDAEKLLGSLLSLAGEKFPGPQAFESLAREAAPPDIEREVLFLQDLLGAVRQLPPQLFSGTEGRMKVLAAAQEATDRAIDREDEFLASQQG
jgi:type III secretion protein W